MDFITDWFLIIIGTYFMYKSYKRIISSQYNSIANYVVLIVYAFCVLPIFFNYIIGKPEYRTIYWYEPFITPMNTEGVNIIYDIYILSSLSMLHMYANYVIKLMKKNHISNDLSKKTILFNNRLIMGIGIISPILVILFSGTWKSYLIFNVSAARGLTESGYSVKITSANLVSLFAFFCCYFKTQLNTKKIIISFIYFAMIIWISGKRFMLANIVILILFFVTHKKLSNRIRKKLKYIVPVIGLFLICFSAYYLTNVRLLSDTSLESVYDMLRVDFGRDDVTKYVIYKEFFQKEMILDYRGQSILGLIFMIVPRAIWALKPYPHYMYLTGSILNLSISDLPAGTTPSWYEMCLANFGILGFFIACISLVLFCYMADKAKSIELKALALLLIIVLLTQSMDAYVIYVLLLGLYFGIKLVFQDKRIKIVWRE